MKALPTDLSPRSGLQVTAVSCPDCGGVLAVVREGEEHPSFRCRVGHRLALVDLLVAKEEEIEFRLWAALTVVAELVALLRDVEDGRLFSELAGLGPQCRERIVRGEMLSQRLRELIERDRPLDFTNDVGSPTDMASP